jgi:hypothetical protein
MIMNKKFTATLAALVVAGGMSAFGQGFVNFSTAIHYVYDDFSTPGTGVTSTSGNIDATFLWAASGSTDPLGTGLATTGVSSAGNAWSTIGSMLTSGWTVAVNAGTSAEADDNPIGTAGQLNYLTANPFALSGSAAGGIYSVVVIAWNNAGGTLNTLEQAEAAGTAVGYSSVFTDPTGASSTSPVNAFSNDGMAKFGVSSVPEPTSIALAGLGGLSMLFLRRRKA